MKAGEEWIQLANCKDTNTRTFFIYREDKNQRLRREAAYSVCRECDVKKECLDYAIVNNEVGIWGGTSDKERRLLRRSWTPIARQRRRLKDYSTYR